MTPKPNLDLLRTIAVALVLVDHILLAKGIQRCGPWYVGEIGLFGVYLFFVHTSLVLMWSLERRPNPLDFYIRRLFRIYPLAIVTILLAAWTHAPVAGNPTNPFHAWPIHWEMLLVNLALLQDLLGRFPTVHGVTWSLPSEVYMYLVLPCLFFYARSLKKIWPLLLIWILSALVARRYIPGEIGNVFPVLIPNFISGVIAYVGFLKYRPTLPSWTLLPLLAILFTFYMSLHGVRSDWLACLALGLLLPRIRQFEAKRPERIAHHIATYSYGIYLFHPFSIVIALYLLQGRPLALEMTVFFVSLFFACIVSYHLIEKPMINLGARVAARLASERSLPSSRSLENLEPAP